MCHLTSFKYHIHPCYELLYRKKQLESYINTSDIFKTLRTSTNTSAQTTHTNMVT